MQYLITIKEEPFVKEIPRNTRKKEVKRWSIRLILISIIPIIFLSTLVLIVYPHYNQIVLAKQELNASRITNYSAINFFTAVSPSIIKDRYEDDFSNVLFVEYVSPEALAKISNEGNVREKLEPKETKVVIDSVNIEGIVRDGEDAFAMEEGPWHFPLSKAPGKKGNFVLIGHRFAELPPSKNTFFNLDKVRIGDKVLITQSDGVEYVYTVIETKVVEKNDRTVLSEYGDYRLTLITCTPLWTSDQRLVVTAILERAYGNT